MATENRLVYASDVRREVLSAEPRLAYIVDRVKTVDAVEVVHGYWIWCGADRWNDAYACSVCGKMTMEDGNYCPNCGAKMD